MAGIVLDASVLIALWDLSDIHHEWALEFFNSTLEYDLFISSLTYAEVMVRPIRHRMQTKFDAGIRGLNLEVVPVAKEHSAALGEIRASSGLAMPDAVVVGAALAASAGLATCDRKLAGVSHAYNLATYAPN